MRTKLPAIVAALAIWATGAYPPWRESYVVRAEVTESGSGQTADHPAVAVATQTISTAIGNDWLINQKGWISPYPVHGDSYRSLKIGLGYSVDYGRLAVEWAIIAALYAGAVVTFRQDAAGRDEAGEAK
jgi:hypothetical protein